MSPVSLGLLVTLSILVQRLLGLPGMPAWSVELLVPLVWLVAPALREHHHRWPYLALVIGLAWDIVFEELIGPGGIAWSAAALVSNGLAGVIADRSSRSWVVFGAVGTLVVTVVRQLALLPLGRNEAIAWLALLRSAVLTGLWCGLVGWALQLDLPSRWQRYRARRLH